MTEDEVYRRMTPLFHEVFDDESLVPTAAMTAADVMAWDSLSNIRLIVAVEEAFDIMLSTSEVVELKNVGEFIEVIQRHLAA
jgi:acyl carrier protein